MLRLEDVVREPGDIDPLLRSIWKYTSSGMREVIASEPIIPAVVRRAKAIAKENPDFVRSDQGQVIGIFPEKEILYGPSAGFDELRELVAKFWTYGYKLKEKLNKDNVAICSGATEALSIILRLIAYKHNIGVMPIYWSNYKGIITSAGGKSIIINIFDKNGDLDIETTQSTIKSNNIIALLINFPLNPSGDTLKENEIRKVAKLARKLDIIIISDEVYNFIRYKGKPQTMLSFAPERTIVIGAASKEYLIPGARTGYILSANKTFTSLWIPRLIRTASSSPNVLGQRVLIDVLKNEVNDLENNRPPRLITKLKKELLKRRDLMLAVLISKGFTIVERHNLPPDGAISLLVRLPKDIKVDDKRFVERALELKKFSAIPGTEFGAPGCLRFGYAGMTEENIRKLSRNLDDVLDSFRNISGASE